MPLIAIRRSSYNGLSNARKESFHGANPNLTLGQPAVYKDGALTWLVFDDSRIGDGAPWLESGRAGGYQQFMLVLDSIPPTWIPSDEAAPTPIPVMVPDAV